LVGARPDAKGPVGLLGSGEALFDFVFHDTRVYPENGQLSSDRRIFFFIHRNFGSG
jgi:hypothetical protein